ncbi:MAG TPA: hypothetical protein VJZ26_13890 [Blastocatellia bacterium]|nr:hypothetical protein [Blastocatellia bacterium]
MICHACQNEVRIEAKVSRTDECAKCSADIHCCLNCEQYDPAAHNRCREPQAEWVSDREKANFCDFFTPNKRAASRKPGVSAADDTRSAFDSLFKK